MFNTVCKCDRIRENVQKRLTKPRNGDIIYKLFGRDPIRQTETQKITNYFKFFLKYLLTNEKRCDIINELSEREVTP